MWKPRYHYIRYKVKDIDSMMRIDVTGRLVYKVKILNMLDGTSMEYDLSNEELKEVEESITKNGEWQVATDENIKQFKLVDTANKYNI